MDKPVPWGVFYFGKFQTFAKLRLALEAIKILTLALFTSLYFLSSPPSESMILSRLKCPVFWSSSWRSTNLGKLNSSLVFKVIIEIPGQMTCLSSYEIRRENSSAVLVMGTTVSFLLLTVFVKHRAKIAPMVQGKQRTTPLPVAQAVWMCFFCTQKTSCSESRMWAVTHGHCGSQWTGMDLRLLGDFRKWKPKDSWISHFFFDYNYIILSIQLVLNTRIIDLGAGTSAGIWYPDTTLWKLQFT